jgi:hypothetical protein
MVLLKLNVSRYQVLRKIVFIVLGKLSLRWKFPMYAQIENCAQLAIIA